MRYSFNTASGRHCCNKITIEEGKQWHKGFNTASDRHCCNNRLNKLINLKSIKKVSIPQAVGTVATSISLRNT